MVKKFKKYDKEAQRTIRIKTDEFNTLLEDANANIRVIPRNIDLRNQYDAYVHNCKMFGEIPLSEFEYDRKYYCAACSFEVNENVPVRLLICKALDVKSIDVRYAKDSYGHFRNDELEVSYRIA